MSGFEVTVIGGGFFLLIGWLGWETTARLQGRKESDNKMVEIETRVTKLEAQGFLTYQKVDELLDKKLAPIAETLNALAIQEHVKPDRRQK